VAQQLKCVAAAHLRGLRALSMARVAALVSGLALKAIGGAKHQRVFGNHRQWLNIRRQNARRGVGVSMTIGNVNGVIAKAQMVAASAAAPGNGVQLRGGVMFYALTPSRLGGVARTVSSFCLQTVVTDRAGNET